jgi:hypothetical protein
MSQPSDSTTVSDAERGTTLGATLLRVAWFAIILGLVIEAVLLVLAAGFGDIPGVIYLRQSRRLAVCWPLKGASSQTEQDIIRST